LLYIYKSISGIGLMSSVPQSKHIHFYKSTYSNGDNIKMVDRYQWLGLLCTINLDIRMYYQINN